MNQLLLDIPTHFETKRLIIRCYQAGDGPMYYVTLSVGFSLKYDFSVPIGKKPIGGTKVTKNKYENSPEKNYRYG